VVDGKVVIWYGEMPNQTVVKKELAFYFVLGLRVVMVALSSSRPTRGYLLIRYDNFMFIEN
jgi:hypothetical protein